MVNNTYYINIRENRRDNPETQAALGTQYTGRRQTKHKTENKQDEQHRPTKHL